MQKMSFSIFNNIAHLFCQFMAQENYAGLGATRDANKFNPSNQENEHGHASASIAAAFAHISVIVIAFLLKCRQNGECACSAPLPKQGACFYLEREKRRCAYSGLGFTIENATPAEQLGVEDGVSSSGRYFRSSFRMVPESQFMPSSMPWPLRALLAMMLYGRSPSCPAGGSGCHRAGKRHPCPSLNYF